MHFTNLASDIQRFGVTLGLAGVTLGLLMTSAAMNLAAGILVFVAALVPIIARLWRSASQKGRHRTFLSTTAGLVGLLFFMVADIGWVYGMHLGLVSLFLLINASLVVVGFVVDDLPMGRHQVAAFAISMGAAVGFLVIVAGLQLARETARETVNKSQADVWGQLAAALATPTPSPTPR